MSTKPAVSTSILEPAAPQILRDNPGRDDGDGAEVDALDLLELVRLRLALADEVPDVTIAASIAAVSAKSDQRSRWLAAFGSPLGRYLAMGSNDLNASLATLVALAQSRAT